MTRTQCDHHRATADHNRAAADHSLVTLGWRRRRFEGLITVIAFPTGAAYPEPVQLQGHRPAVTVLLVVAGLVAHAPAEVADAVVDLLVVGRRRVTGGLILVPALQARVAGRVG